jgi:predicted dehydrogenase
LKTTPSPDKSPETAAIAARWDPFPEIDLRQLLRMTDDTGIFQHAVHGVPDPNHGYCIDDNARALIAALLHAQLRGHDERVVPMARYLGFLAYAYNEKRQRFRNFMGYDRRWLEDEGSQDSQARTYWALGLTVHLAPTSDIRELAQNLFLRSLPIVKGFEFLRSWAFTLIGLEHYLRFDPEHTQCRDLRELLANRLFNRWRDEASDDWPWWDETVTYDNAKLCHALLRVGPAMGRPEMTDAGLRSLEWLLGQQTETEADGSTHLSIIGNDGWLQRGEPRARFDQQPLEAYALADACLAAARVVDDADQQRRWADRAWWCFEWFTGRNDLGVSLYHPDTGGCQDGLRPDGPNKNQGAESVLAYLLTVLELHRYRADRMRVSHVAVQPPKTIGLGVVGASGFADFCLEAYAGLEGVRPAAIWNRTRHKAEKLAGKHGMTVADDLPALLADPAVHLVHIATTPDLHAEHARAALVAGKHVLVEKPLATTLADADEMLRTAAHRDRVLAVNFVMRYGPLIEPMKKLLDSGALGAPLRGQFTNRAGDAGLPPDHWFWDDTVSGGIFVEHGVHFFDLLRHLLGDATILSAHRLRRPDTNLVDQVACDARYGAQTAVGFYHGFTQAPPTDQQDLRLIFERGELRVFGWVFAELVIDAVLSDQQIGQIEAALPGCAVQTLTHYEGEGATVSRRHRREAVDRQVRITWRDERDKQAIYAAAARDLLADVLRSIHDRHHELPVRGSDARAALGLALEADRLAKGVTP